MNQYRFSIALTLAKILSAAACVLLIACASGSRLSSQQIQARAYYSRAQNLFGQELWEQTIVTLDSVVAIDSTHAAAFALRGISKHNAGYSVSESLADLDRSLEIQPSGDAFFVRAVVRHAAGMLEGALEDCDQAILYAEAKGFDPNLVRAQKEKGESVTINLGPELNAQYEARRERAVALRERILQAEKNPSIIQDTLEFENSPTKQSEDKPAVPFYSLTEKPQLIKGQDPVYPELAKKAGIEGVVVLKVLINTMGDVEKVEVIKSQPLLDDAAIEAVQQYKYKPGKKDLNPVKVWLSIPIKFKLPKN